MGIRLHALGGLKVFRDGEEVGNLRSWKRRLGLLIYLAYQGESTRDQLTGLFWPEKPERKARSSLSTAVSDLRKACGRECILTQGEIYRVSSDVELDARLFQQAVERGENEEALRLYQGPFLSGLSLVQTSAFQQWVGSAHSRLTGLHRKARSSKIEALTEAGQLTEALSHARRWVELEPEDDGPVQLTMKLLATDGRRAEALQQFETFQRAMALMDEEPLEETTELADRIRSGDEVGPVRMPALDGRGARAVEKREAPREAEYSGQADLTPLSTERGRGDPSGEEDGPDFDDKDQPHKLIQALKERWIFRVALTYAAALFVWIQIGDALISVFAIPQLTVLRITTLGLAAIPAVFASVWALEPWMRGRRRGKGGSGSLSPGLPFHIQAMWRALVTLAMASASVGIGLVTWPGESELETAGTTIEPLSARHGFAILPLLPEDTADAMLVSVSSHLTRSLISHFRSFDVLNVPSDNRVAEYATDRPPLDSILSHLGVELLLGGYVGRRGDSLLLTLDLESPGVSGDHLESRVPLQEGLNEIELVQMVTAQVTERLQMKLRGEFEARELRLGTANPEAWRLAREGEDERYRAMSLIRRREFTSAARALEAADSLLSAASEEDPAWPDPLVFKGFLAVTRISLGRMAESSDSQSPLVVSVEEAPRILRQGLALVNSGLALDPTNKEGLFRKAEVLRFLSLYPEHPDSIGSLNREIERTLESAIRGDPPRPDAMLRLAQLRFGQGAYREAGELYETAYERDVFLHALPNDILNLGRIRLETNRELLGMEECGKGDSEASVWTRYMRHECQLLLLAFGEELEPNVTLAEALAQDTAIQGPGMGRPGGVPNPRLLTLYAAVLARAGLPDSARTVHAVAQNGSDFPPGDYDVGVLTLLGDFPEAVEILRRRSSEDLHSKLFDPLRGYAPFDSLETGSGGGSTPNDRCPLALRSY